MEGVLANEESNETIQKQVTLISIGSIVLLTLSFYWFACCYFNWRFNIFALNDTLCARLMNTIYPPPLLTSWATSHSFMFLIHLSRLLYAREMCRHCYAVPQNLLYTSLQQMSCENIYVFFIVGYVQRFICFGAS
jgi:hypothetical protein